MTPTLGDIMVSLAAEEPALRIVARIGRDADPLAAVEWFRPDVVITDAGDAYVDGLRGAVLRSGPGVRLLTMVQHGRVVHVDRLVPQRRTITDVSGRELLSAILDAPSSYPCDAEERADPGSRSPYPRPTGTGEVEPWK
jgi:hypothetical protein